MVLSFCLLAVGTAAAADAAPCFGKYKPWSQGCNGAAYLRAKTIEWRTTWSYCKPSAYEVIDIASKDEPPHIAVRIKKRSKRCGFDVVEIEQLQYDMKMWSLNGYPSLEAYQKRDLPEWKNAVSDARMRLTCPLDPRDDPRV
ncbi:hypothetical protein QTI17_15990 [Variovorax sp. J31P179]|uniref:hypothetical protein n=1 Tax=Variovorax sp. J31P179 TaxID=3053508 RepID=UPI0025786C13|nr:hypothetical protein [Variovorax sp. J31P179]MDM0082096.1 hypothetical protein [Variovorax sp. J31P179]